jgi:hypothetical protein
MEKNATTCSGTCFLVYGEDASDYVVPAALHVFHLLPVIPLDMTAFLATSAVFQTIHGITNAFETAAHSKVAFVLIRAIKKFWQNAGCTERDILMRELTCQRYYHIYVIATSDINTQLLPASVDKLFRAEKLEVPIASAPTR